MTAMKSEPVEPTPQSMGEVDWREVGSVCSYCGDLIVPPEESAVPAICDNCLAMLAEAEKNDARRR